MDRKLRRLYATLVPKDRVIIDAMILALVDKDREIKNLTTGVLELIEKQKEPI